MEIEFKFHIPAHSLKAVEKELRGRAARVMRTHLLARYFDTADGALARHGVALRLRKEGRRWVQTAKALGEGAVHRLEHNADLGMVRGGPPAVDALRHQGTPVGDRLDELLDKGRVPLVQTFATDIWRVSRHVRFQGSTVELALDTGRVIAPAPAGEGADRVAPVCELELELVDGEVPALVALAQRWSQRHGLWFSTVSKAERGERLRAGETPRAVKAAAPRFRDRDCSGAQVQRVVVSACLDQILPNATEVAGGSEDAEVVHQLRVGIRRLRSALRELDGLAPGRFDLAAWEPALVEAFRALGALRDRDVLEATLRPRLQAAGAPMAELPRDDAAARVPSAAEVVCSARLQQVLVALIGFSAPDGHWAEAGQEEGEAVRAMLAKRLNKLHRQLVRDGKRFEALPTEQQHRARKRLKRLRYLAEFVAPLFHAAKAGRYIEQLLPAQDALGDYNDEVVAIEAYSAAAAQDPRAWFAVGWLTARRPAKARDCGKALGRLGRASKFWK